jgi:hypothetical protein
MDTQQKIQILFENFSEFLIKKNKLYGDAAFNCIKVFSKHDPTDPVSQRIDEKINRIMNSEEGLRKNDVIDLFGYLALKMIEKGWTSFDEFID